MARAKKPDKGPPIPPEPKAGPEHIVDQAVRFKNPAMAPEAERPAIQAVLKAFHTYSQKDDEVAKAALNEIGMTSPLIEWKLLLRGLMAYDANDDARALENWRRLDASRLPSRLAAPFRAKLDAEFVMSLHPSVAARLPDQFARLQGNPLMDSLHLLRKELSGAQKKLSKCFQILEKLSGLVRTQQPKLWARLAEILYWSITKQGEPEDMPKYLRIFGRYPSDPDFHRINAMGYEHNVIPEAITYWTKYEQWLATKPAAVPATLVNNIRGKVLLHIVGLIEEGNQQGGAPNDLMEAFRMIMGGRADPTAYGLDAKLKLPDPIKYLEAAQKLAPDDEDITVGYVEALFERGQGENALITADTYLAGYPDSLPVLKTAFMVASTEHEYVKCYEYAGDMFRINPLDPESMDRLLVTRFIVTQHQLIKGELTEAKKLLSLEIPQKNSWLEAAFGVFKVLLAWKQKDAALAQDELTKAREVQDNAAVVKFLLGTMMGLMKFKPAERKPYEAELAEMWKTTLPYEHVEKLFKLFIFWQIYGLDFRGLAANQKKTQASLLEALSLDPKLEEANVVPFAQGISLGFKDEKFAIKYLETAAKRFPKSFHFPLLLAEFYYLSAERKGTKPNFRKLDMQARKAYNLLRFQSLEVQEAEQPRFENIQSPPEFFGGY
jgi:hypothetical protein